MEQKECKNCKYYVQIYAKRKGRLHLTSDGHCHNYKPNGHSRKTDKICESYQESDLEKEQEQEIKSATEWLAKIAKDINDLILIFNLLLEKKENENISVQNTI